MVVLHSQPRMELIYKTKPSQSYLNGYFLSSDWFGHNKGWIITIITYVYIDLRLVSLRAKVSLNRPLLKNSYLSAAICLTDNGPSPVIAMVS